MDRQAKLHMRREQDRRRANEKRKAHFVAEYVQIKYPTIYNEASEFYQKLDALHPNKNDLRKVDLFKHLKKSQTQQETTAETTQQVQYNDNMLLEIPLTRSLNIAEEGTDLQQKQNEVIDSIQPTLLDDIPEDLLQRAIDELQLEPKFNLDELDIGLNIEIDIPDDLLEKELACW